ncbi:MAG: hypothetical protein EPO21_13880 [Chloroflexota bacterium]|nr:MAG: hypothetical protein EPO21_13880 [Chloroflexota bacterium]
MTTDIVKATLAGRPIEEADTDREAETEHPIALVARKLRNVGMLLLLFLPLVFSPNWSQNLFEIPKSTALALFTILTVASGLTYILVRGRFSLRRTAVDVPLVVLLAISVLSTIVSVSPLGSLYGEHNRRDGLLTIANYALLFFMAVNYYREWRNIRQTAEIVGLVAAFVGLLGVLEYFDLSVHVGPVRETFEGRVFATLGNPDFLGAYLVLMSPLAIGLLLISRSISMKLLWSGAFLLMSVCLLLTMTRGAWIGFAASLLVIVAFARTMRSHARWLVGLLIALVLFGSAAEVSSLWWQNGTTPAAHPGPGGGAVAPPAPSLSLLERLKSMTSLQGGTVGVRFETWQQALDIVRDYPILGSGLNTFQAMATRYYSPTYAAGEGATNMPDRPHNQYLQWAAFAGVPGALAYLAVLGVVSWTVLGSLRRAPRGPRKLLLITLFAGWVGYLVQNFFLFDTIETGPQFWLMTALAVAMTGPRAVRIRLWSSSRFRTLAWPAGAAVVVASLFLAFLAIRPQVADVLYLRSQMLGHPGASSADEAAAYSYLEQAIAWAPDDLYYREMYALGLMGRIANPTLPQAEKALEVRTALKMANSVINDNPMNGNVYFTRGAIRELSGPNHESDAYQDFARTITLHPYHLPANAAMARLGRQMGRMTDVIAAERRILVVDPQNVPALTDLSQDYLVAGRLNEAEGLINRLASLVPDEAIVPFLQGWLHESRRDLGAAEREYVRALERQPEFAAAKAALERVKAQ